MRRHAGSILILTGMIFAAFGALLLLFGWYQSSSAGGNSEAALASLESLLPDKTQGTIVGGSDSSTGMPAVEINGRSYAGILELSSQDGKWPVAESESSADCPYVSEGTAESGTLVIAGTNYQDLFGKLNELGDGASVKFTDVRGNVYDYQVTSISEAQGPSGTSYDLQLRTSNKTGTQKVFVNCAGIRS